MNDEPSLNAAPAPNGATPAPATVPVRPWRLRTLLLVWAGVAAFAYTVDQLTKWWVSSSMTQGQITVVIPGVLNWYYIKNSGAAFSIGENFTWFFTLVMSVVAVVIFTQARKLGSAWWAIALGLVLGGALGNLTDRLFREPSFGMGHVVDFISFWHFAIFNLADSAIVGGIITLCILTLAGIPLRGRRRPVAAGEPGGAPRDGHDGGAGPGTEGAGND